MSILETIVHKFRSPNERVRHAVAKRDPAALEAAILGGGSVEYMPSSYTGTVYYGDSPVHTAIGQEDLECLRVLIRHGAHLNSAGLARQPSLNSWFDRVKMRVDKGARLEDLPDELLEMGALLMENGATVGSGGRGAVLSGSTPQKRIDEHPELSRIQRYIRDGAYRAHRHAQDIEQATAPATGVRRSPRM